MSLELIRIIRCDIHPDGPDGEQCETAWGCPVEQPSAGALRAYLKERGWHRTSSGDVCPTCWTAGHR